MQKGHISHQGSDEWHQYMLMNAQNLRPWVGFVGGGGPAIPGTAAGRGTAWGRAAMMTVKDKWPQVIMSSWRAHTTTKTQIFCTMDALQFPLPDPIPGIDLPPSPSHPPTTDDVEHGLTYLNQVQQSYSETLFIVLFYICIHSIIQAATRQHMQNLKLHMSTLHVFLMHQAETLVSNP